MLWRISRAMTGKGRNFQLEAKLFKLWAKPMGVRVWRRRVTAGQASLRARRIGPAAHRPIKQPIAVGV